MKHVRVIIGWGAPWAPIVLFSIACWLLIVVVGVTNGFQSKEDTIFSLGLLGFGVLALVISVKIFFSAFCILTTPGYCKIDRKTKVLWTDVDNVIVGKLTSGDAIFPATVCPVLVTQAGSGSEALEQLAGFSRQGSNRRVEREVALLKSYINRLSAYSIPHTAD